MVVGVGLTPGVVREVKESSLGSQSRPSVGGALRFAHLRFGFGFSGACAPIAHCGMAAAGHVARAWMFCSI